MPHGPEAKVEKEDPAVHARNSRWQEAALRIKRVAAGERRQQGWHLRTPIGCRIPHTATPRARDLVDT